MTRATAPERALPLPSSHPLPRPTPTTARLRACPWALPFSLGNRAPAQVPCFLVNLLGRYVVFDRLLRALPEELKKRDRHGIVAKLEQLGLCPLAAQNVEHMLCEYRKMALPSQRAHRGEQYAAYAKLWTECAPMLARRAGYGDYYLRLCLDRCS